MIRIVSGRFKNQKLLTPKGLETRPTSEKLRAAVFNIIQHKIEDSTFLDLFAGSGAIGFEALSRGASSVTFVDQNSISVECIKKNSKAFNIEENVKVLKKDAFKVIEQLSSAGQLFDVIYVDPPYTKSQTGKMISESILQLLDAKTLLKEAGVIFVEESNFVNFEELALNTLELIRTRKFGSSQLFEFENKGK